MLYNQIEVITMAKVDTVTMRVDPKLKHQAEALCKDMGLTLSTAYTIFLKAIVNTRSIPFPIQASDPQPTKKTLAALREADDIASGKMPAKIYHSAAELIQEAKDETNAEDCTNVTVQKGLEEIHSAAS